MTDIHSNWMQPSLQPMDTVRIPPDLLTSLRQHALFQRTNNESFLERLACVMHLRTYGARDVIIKKDEPARAMFFLLRGSVDVCSADYERIYATLPKGSCFGEIGILYSMPRTATVIAKTKCTVAALTAEEVSTLLPQFPEVEKILRFEAEERLALLKKSKESGTKLNRKPSVERNVESFCETGARVHLQRMPLFSQCPEEFLHSISLKVEPRHYPPNALIIRKGDIGTEVFFIVDGTVEVTTLDPNTVIARLGAGDFFGEIGILLNVPRTANIRSVTNLEVYVLNRADFLTVCSRYPDLQRQFRDMAETALHNLQEKILELDETAINTVTEGCKYVPIDEQHYGAPLGSIAANSVCRTTSDQDPTLPTVVDVLRHTETKKRRASVAVWSDPSLLQFAQSKSISPPLEPQKPDHAYTSPLALEQGSFMMLNKETLIRLVDYLDFASILKLAGVSRNCRHFLENTEEILHQVDLCPHHRRVTDDTVIWIANFINNRARKLSLSQCFHLTDTGLKSMVQQGSNLIELDVNSCWLLTDQSLALIGSSCPELVSINLSNCRKITDAGVLALLEEKAARNYPRLTEIILSYCKNLTDQTMHHLAKYNAKSLERLNIQRCTKITDDGFMAWADQLFPSLQHVVLNDCSFLTDKAIAYLIAAAPHIQHLSVSFCCALSDSAVEDLGQLNQLTELDASFCGAAVSDASICTLLKKSPLSVLNIRGCVRIRDTGLQTIVETGQLRYLNVSQCSGVSRQVKDLLLRSNSVKTFIV
ncbi:hypothetical protein EC973_004979 [Apophysomyces ossiformis]|uniref:Cyclic nucleotide-binding domain-containing protein n=1 Tax=Apophysomyces ossiformis TaxID=679940 RepID=A0A8H7BJY1_9FUNG|nr:hypothetical protein EC973_004979 [Apophysomyces ossiformis]